MNSKGEFISGAEGEWLLNLAEKSDFEFAEIENIGSYSEQKDWIEKHIEMVLDLPLVDREAIAAADFKVAVDAVNSTGGLAIPVLLKALGVKTVFPLYCDPNGKFPHNPPSHCQPISLLCLNW